MISFDLPSEIERELRSTFGDLNVAAREALLIEAYRQGRISIGDLAAALGFATKFEAEQWLGRRGVDWNYGPEDLKDDRKTLDRLLGAA